MTLTLAFAQVPQWWCVALHTRQSPTSLGTPGELRRDMGRPNTNSDHLAPLLRDRLMPLRSKCVSEGWAKFNQPPSAHGRLTDFGIRLRAPERHRRWTCNFSHSFVLP
jgi:hypothetical protein